MLSSLTGFRTRSRKLRLAGILLGCPVRREI